MTKSNARAVRRRKTNQRIQRQYDRVEQDRVRAYQERSMDTRSSYIADGMNWSGWFRKTIRRVTSFFNRMFSGGGRTLRRLDLRSSDADRFGAFAPDRRRNVGATVLRDWFPNLGRMVSTRDGRRV